ncbi:MAG: 30S ribosomal protein S12 methylthiotransferase RimO [Parachlamydiales bacterium]|jgi:ribosomal protein S12 methylthiotransferase
MAKKFHLISLGCGRNLVDSEVMLALLAQAGYEPSLEIAEADFIIVNTCGFLQSARKEAVQTLQRVFSSIKKGGRVIVAGCMVEKFQNDLEKLFPELFFYLGAGNVEEILEAVKSPVPGRIITKKSYLNSPSLPRVLATALGTAYLKIAEGCSKHCAYCLIPAIKGPLKSRPIEAVVEEFKNLLKRGVFEVVLIAQDLGDYGKDLYGKSALKQLLRELLEVKGAFWLRLLYLYPEGIDVELADLFQSDPRLLPYLDMPLQHISDKLLRRMRRKTSQEQIFNAIGLLKARVPKMVLRTTLMVGFPGEGKKEFQELLAFVKSGRIDHIGFFAFSPEKGTAAFHFPDQVDEKVKAERLQTIAEAQYRKVQKQNRRFLKQTLEVLVEGYHPDSKRLLKGRFYGQAPEVDPVVILNDFALVQAFGCLYQVQITGFAGYDLLGSAVGPKA